MEANFEAGRDYTFKDSMFFTFKGRINRLSFFLRIIALIVIVFFSALAISFFVGMLAMFGPVGFILAIIVTIGFAIAIWIASLSLYVRRLHDMNLSGMLVFGYVALSILISALEFADTNSTVIMLRLIFNVLVIISFLILLFWPGTKGPNKYGEDPLGRNNDYIDEVFGDGKPKPNYANEYTPAYLRQSNADSVSKADN